MNAGDVRDTLNFLLCSVLLAKADVLANRRRKQLRLLKDVRDLSTEAFHIEIVDVHAIYEHFTFGRDMETRHQIGQACLPSPGRTNKGNNLAN